VTAKQRVVLDALRDAQHEHDGQAVSAHQIVGGVSRAVAQARGPRDTGARAARARLGRGRRGAGVEDHRRRPADARTTPRPRPRPAGHRRRPAIAVVRASDPSRTRRPLLRGRPWRTGDGAATDAASRPVGAVIAAIVRNDSRVFRGEGIPTRRRVPTVSAADVDRHLPELRRNAQPPTRARLLRVHEHHRRRRRAARAPRQRPGHPDHPQMRPPLSSPPHSAPRTVLLRHVRRWHLSSVRRGAVRNPRAASLIALWWRPLVGSTTGSCSRRSRPSLLVAVAIPEGLFRPGRAAYAVVARLSSMAISCSQIEISAV